MTSRHGPGSGAAESEVTGRCETPAGKAIFVKVQHPGEDIAAADLGDPLKCTSLWASKVGIGAGQRDGT